MCFECTFPVSFLTVALFQTSTLGTLSKLLSPDMTCTFPTLHLFPEHSHLAHSYFLGSHSDSPVSAREKPKASRRRGHCHALSGRGVSLSFDMGQNRVVLVLFGSGPEENSGCFAKHHSSGVLCSG